MLQAAELTRAIQPDLRGVSDSLRATTMNAGEIVPWPPPADAGSHPPDPADGIFIEEQLPV